jgi:hypothetical protein
VKITYTRTAASAQAEYFIDGVSFAIVSDVGIPLDNQMPLNTYSLLIRHVSSPPLSPLSSLGSEATEHPLPSCSTCNMRKDIDVFVSTHICRFYKMISFNTFNK